MRHLFSHITNENQCCGIPWNHKLHGLKRVGIERQQPEDPVDILHEALIRHQGSVSQTTVLRTFRVGDTDVILAELLDHERIVEARIGLGAPVRRPPNEAERNRIMWRRHLC